MRGHIFKTFLPLSCTSFMIILCIQHWLILVLIVHCAMKQCACCLGYGAMWIGSAYQQFVGACCFLLRGGQFGTFIYMYIHTHTHTHQSTQRHMQNNELLDCMGLDLRGYWFQSRSRNRCLCAIKWRQIL